MKNTPYALRGLMSGLLALAAGTAEPVSATVISFTNEAAWQAAMAPLGGHTLHNFDTLALNDPGTVIGQPHLTLTTQIPGITFSNAEIIPSCCGGGVNSSPNVVLNYPDLTFSGDIVIVFDQPVFGVGLWNASNVDGETFEIFDSNDVSIASLVSPVTPVNFGGFTVDAAMGIKKLVISPGPGGNGSIFIDDLQVGASTISSTPDGGTTALMLGIGLLGLAGVKRKLRKA